MTIDRQSVRLLPSLTEEKLNESFPVATRLCQRMLKRLLVQQQVSTFRLFADGATMVNQSIGVPSTR